MGNKALNKKLAEWAGLDYDASGAIYNPDEGTWCYNFFTESLDACFRWLVPKILNMGRNVCLMTVGNDWIFIISPNEIYEVDSAKTPALAICGAVEKFIDTEK